MTVMRAVVLTALGGPDVLQLREIPLGWPRGPHDVLVRLRAAGLNPADAYFRGAGTYLKSDGPCVLGHDGAGVVEVIGGDVTAVAAGDRVCFCNGGIGGEPGTYAEFAVVDERQLAKLPEGIGWREAAALPLTAITAYEALYERARLAAGERVLIHGGAGGTGQMAVQLAKLRGARIAATVSSAAKAALVTALGAECAIDYRSEDFVATCRGWSGGAGLDVALDNVGGDVMVATFAAMAPYGRVVTLMGTPADDAAMTAYNSNLSIHNVMMLTPMWRRLKPQLYRQAGIIRQAVAWLARGDLEVRIEAAFPLAEAASAHRRLEAGGLAGKIVLDISG